MTGITPEMTQVINIPAFHPAKLGGNASKKVDYLPFLLPTTTTTNARISIG
jgi:hypothetical protein